MKDIGTIIGFLIFIVFALLPTILKLSKSEKTVPAKAESDGESETFEPDISDVSEQMDNDSKLQKNVEKVPKEPDYFTYETIGDEVGENGSNASNDENKFSQSVENEVEEKEKLTLSEEEIYKGVIYSEILKRKFN